MPSPPVDLPAVDPPAVVVSVPTEWALGGYVGAVNAVGAEARDPGLVAGGRLRWRPRPEWAVEVAGGWDGVGADPRVSVVHLFGDPYAAMVPQLWVGFGARVGGEVHPLGEAGVGLDVSLFPWLDLRADGAARVTFDGEAAFVFTVGPQVHPVHRYDADGDGVPDSQDGCRTHPEDRDGYADADGCPDPDNDGDGVDDAEDLCPAAPEDVDGFLDRDGCPDPDNDGDGRPDVADLCSMEPEDEDGFEDGDGCFDPDNDGDHLYDGVDRCPNVPEDEDGFEDGDGCPEPDNDGDGVGDLFDGAPDQPETINGYLDEDGVPDVLPPILARFVGVVPGVRFEAEGPALHRDGLVTVSLLASVLQTYPKVRVEVRVTDPSSDLAGARVAAVGAALVGDGVDAARLELTAGVGEAAVTVRLVP